MEKRIISDFESEAEEADWWFDNQDELDKDFTRAAAEGRLVRRTAVRMAMEAATSISLDANDVELARGLAEKRGLEFKTYIKMLLHEELVREAQTL